MSEFSQFKSTPLSSPIDVKDAVARQQLQSTQSVSGNPITITDAAPINAEKLEVVLEPKQDLHGQSAPYVGGAGKNLLEVTATTTTTKDVTFTVNSDGTISTSGTANGYIVFECGRYTSTGETYSASGCPSGGVQDSTYWMYFGYMGADEGSGVSNKTVQSGNPIPARIYVNSGTNMNGKIFKPMIEKGSTVTQFAPWENICPITGYTECDVDDVGKNRMDFAGFLTASNQSFTETDSTFSIPLITNEVLGWYEFSDNDVQVVCSIDDITGSVNNPRIEFRQNGSLAGIVVNSSNKQITVTCSAFRMNYSAAGSCTVVKPMIRLATDTDATFEPYRSSNATIQFGQTVYGGKSDFVEGGTDDKYDVVDMGDLDWDRTASYANAFFYATITGSKNAGDLIAECYKTINPVKAYIFGANANNGECAHSADTTQVFVRNDAYTDPSAFKTAMTGQTICYELATPTTISTPPAPLRLLKGTNNLSTDGTSMTIGYQPDNVIGELKEDLQQHTEMEWLQVMFSGQQTDFKDIQLQDDSSIALRLILADLEVFKHRFMLFEIYRKQNDSITYTNASLMLSISSLVEATYGYNATLGFNNGVNANFNVRIIYFQGNYEIMAAIYTDASSPLTNLYARARLVD